ncbi:MAG: hypothetical protein HYW49_09415 [Deltaproteobacteria bacterium]|nr:hypothetical protein [Deltaproteobacteria bacterium]
MRSDKNTPIIRRLLLIALLGTAALSGPPAFGQEKNEQAFQAIPRNSTAECSTAQEKLAAKMLSLGFTDIVSGCATMNDDTGSHPIPILQGKHSKKFSGETALGPRRATLESCKSDLAELLPKGAEIIRMESECIKGTETDYKGTTTTFWQSYVFYLKDESAAATNQSVPVIQPSVNDSTRSKDVPLDENEKAKRDFINSSKTLPR